MARIQSGNGRSTRNSQSGRSRNGSSSRSSSRSSAGSRSSAASRGGLRLASVNNLARSARDYYDYNLLAAVILLTCFGLVMLYSTSAYEATVNYGTDTFYFRKQAGISIAAFVLLLFGSQIDYHKYIGGAPILYLVSMALLVATKFVGREVNGAKRWIYIGPLSFQPAELAKLAVILFLPYLIVRFKRQSETGKMFKRVLGFAFIAAFFTYFFTENLSTALIIAGICGVLIFIVYPNWRQLIAIAGGGVLVIIAGLAVVLSRLNGQSESFRLRRIMVWLHPEDYADLGGYQVLQGLYAIGSGGFFGKGLGKSTQKLGALPEAQNDMIFSIICEELGVFGALLIIGLFLFLLYRLFFIATNAPDLLGSLIVSGIFVHIALQFTLNIAVVINLIPTTGITLPFVSYGGTSIVFLMAEMTVALAVSKQIQFR